MALGIMGEDAIRSFDDGNKRARMADVFYDITRDYVLTQFDWPFARKQLQLNMLAESPDWVPDGTYAYQLPTDCMQPIDVLPEGSHPDWEVRGKVLFGKFDEDYEVILLYTRTVLDETLFSVPFANLLATALAVRLIPSLTADKDLAKNIFAQFELEKVEAWANGANVGSKQPSNDNNADYDSFIYPDEYPPV